MSFKGPTEDANGLGFWDKIVLESALRHYIEDQESREHFIDEAQFMAKVAKGLMSRYTGEQNGNDNRA